ncbi:MAG: AAA family ATPase [Pirellulales bacterium]
MELTTPLNDQLVQVLLNHQVQVIAPRNCSTQLNAVLAGPDFTKPRTNVLLRCRDGHLPWEIFVDEDFRYQGDDPQRRRLFSGPRHRNWLALTPPKSLRGNVNDAILRVLEWLDSPLRNLIDVLPGEPHRPSQRQIEAELERVGRVLDPAAWKNVDIEPTAQQAEAIACVAEVAARGMAPNCPILFGASGSGKSMVARLAAGRLVERGVVRQVVEISGAGVCSGAIFLPERDERLRQTLEIVHGAGDTLAVLDHIDLTLAKAELAPAILADYLDGGLRLIGVARPEINPCRFAEFGTLTRRLKLVPLVEPERDELQKILRRHFEKHPLSRKVCFPAETLATVLAISQRRPGANPADALGLLEAALIHAQWAGLESISPDDLYHVAKEIDHASFE